MHVVPHVVEYGPAITGVMEMSSLKMIGKNHEAARAALATSFRARFPINADKPYILRSEDEAAEHYFHLPQGGGSMCHDRRSGAEKGQVKVMLPARVWVLHEKLRDDDRFEQFILYAKGGESSGEGMIIGKGVHKKLYVLVTWDAAGINTWKPRPEDIKKASE